MKEWTKPKIIVLFHGRPEERVLACCKNGTTGGTSDIGAVQGNCEAPEGGTSCPDCSTLDCS